MKIIDTHCHLYLPEFLPQLKEYIDRAIKIGIDKICLPAIESTYLQDMLAIANLYPTLLFNMIGLHPCYVKENYEAEKKIIEENFHTHKFIAIGEIGLDYYWDITFKKQQIEMFEWQMEFALEHKLPIVIHSRNAMEDTLNLVKPFANKGLSGIFHCFGDDENVAKKIMDMGFYLGVGGIITYKKVNLIETLQKIGLNKVVLETDAPYLSPNPLRGKQNEPANLQYIINFMATNLNIPAEKITETTTKNAENIFFKP
ncbi:MAG: TatD family hydrolase [Sediminibacterium sp.]|nr:TatD family hydrolase [Sediminibacterium sp.]